MLQTLREEPRRGMRSSYTAVAIGVCDGSEVCGMGRPMPAEVARGGGDLGWRSGALGGRQILTALLEVEQRECSAAQYGTNPSWSMSSCRSVSIAGRWRLDADIGQGGRRRPMAVTQAFHSISSQHGKRPPFDLTSSHRPRHHCPVHVRGSVQPIQDSICLLILSTKPSKHSPQPPAPPTPPIPRYMSDSPPPQSSAHMQHEKRT